MKTHILIFGLLILTVSCVNSGITSREKSSAMIRKVFIQEMENEGLQAIGTGGAEREGKTTQISVSFQINKLMDIASAREIIVEAGSSLIDIINTTENISQFFVDYPVSSSIVRIIIIGKKPPPEDSLNYVLTVFLTDGKVRYTTDDPNPENLRLYTVHEESFDEALAIIDTKKNK